MVHSRRKKSTPSAGLLHLLFLVFVNYLEVSAPAEQFLDGHRGADFGQTHAQFLGNAELKHEPVVFAKFRA